jgi:hypothetical protein
MRATVLSRSSLSNSKPANSRTRPCPGAIPRLMQCHLPRRSGSLWANARNGRGWLGQITHKGSHSLLCNTANLFPSIKIPLA